MKSRHIPVEIQRTDTRELKFKLSKADIEWLVANALAQRVQLSLGEDGVSYVYYDGDSSGETVVVITQDYTKLPTAPNEPLTGIQAYAAAD